MFQTITPTSSNCPSYVITKFNTCMHFQKLNTHDGNQLNTHFLCSTYILSSLLINSSLPYSKLPESNDLKRNLFCQMGKIIPSVNLLASKNVQATETAIFSIIKGEQELKSKAKNKKSQGIILQILSHLLQLGPAVPSSS